MIPIGSTTRILGVIGDPIAHSRSPAMHNAAFRLLGMDRVYLAFRVAPDAVATAVSAVRALGLEGLNVTVPHKEAVIPHLDRLSPVARACGAVNTIVNRHGSLLGDNTDVVGLLRDLADLGLPGSAKLSSAVVIGAGGSARAIVYAVSKIARRVVVAARREERAWHLVGQMANRVRPPLAAVPLAELAPKALKADEVLAAARLVVNATPLGLKGERFAPLDYASTPADCLFYDLIYTRAKTPFLAPAARLGRPTANGLGMLLHQGARAFELWTGVAAPLGVMRRALYRGR